VVCEWSLQTATDADDPAAIVANDTVQIVVP